MRRRRFACAPADDYLAFAASEREWGDVGCGGRIVLGLISGFIASKAVSGRGSGCLANIALGLVGALIGGLLFSYFGHTDPMRFNLTSMVIGIIGAVIALLIWRGITGRRGLR